MTMMVSTLVIYEAGLVADTLVADVGLSAVCVQTGWMRGARA